MQTRLKSINFPEVLPQPIKFVYMIRFFINAVALFYFFGKTIQTVYMPESSFLFIIFPSDFAPHTQYGKSLGHVHFPCAST